MCRKVYRFAGLGVALIAGLLLGRIEVNTALAQQPEPQSADEQLLFQHGVGTDAAGIAAYLSNLFPTEALQREISRLIEQLGSDDFGDREAASRKLASIGAAHDALQQATRHTDAEVSHRARRILEDNEQWRESVLMAVLRLIQKEKPPGVASHLLRALPLCEKEHLRRAASDALIASVGRDDAALLGAAIKSEKPEVRTAAIVALERVLKEGAVEPLRPMLKAADPATRLAAVEALVNRVPGECLGVLVGLLESNEQPLRVRSDRILRALTGQRFGSIHDTSAESRREMAIKWRRWVEGPGHGAVLNVPLPIGKTKLGRVLVCLHQNGGPNGVMPQLAELNDLWQLSVLSGGNGNMMLPFGCQGQPDGRRLYTDWRSQMIVELDENGKQVWQKNSPNGPASSVERLENGNLLVAIYQNRQVAEIDRNGQIVWQINVGGAASDAHQLENGNVLVVLCDQGIVAEFDREGRTVWKATGLQNPWSARRVAGGNTVVACSGASRVVEVSPDSRIVRTLENIPNCSDADMLENGNLLIGYQQGLREVNPQGQTVREHPIGYVRRLSIY